MEGVRVRVRVRVRVSNFYTLNPWGRGGGYLFQASGFRKGKDFIS